VKGVPQNSVLKHPLLIGGDTVPQFAGKTLKGKNNPCYRQKTTYPAKRTCNKRTNAVEYKM